MNELQRAAHDGSAERIVALLSRGATIDIDAGTPKGHSPLMLATFRGHSRVVKILLNKGANTSVKNFSV